MKLKSRGVFSSFHSPLSYPIDEIMNAIICCTKTTKPVNKAKEYDVY